MSRLTPQGSPEPYSHQIRLYLPSRRRGGGGGAGHTGTQTRMHLHTDGNGIAPNTVALHPGRGEAPESLCPEQGHPRTAYVFLTENSGHFYTWLYFHKYTRVLGGE